MMNKSGHYIDILRTKSLTYFFPSMWIDLQRMDACCGLTELQAQEVRSGIGSNSAQQSDHPLDMHLGSNYH